ncbi:MAG TPA: hypothetical protein VEF04_18335 [Blastocatellia bacterium]|nr:hypothetical protein [Blastocatellia bacterium]
MNIVISASVPGTLATSSQPVSVNDKGFWQAKNAISVLATVAAIGIAAIVVVNRREDKIPIKATGPTLVIP